MSNTISSNKTLADVQAITASKGQASGLASLNGSSQVVERLSYEASASGVATLNGSSLVVQNPASKGQASGIAELNGSSLVVQNPANATATPTASKLPIADGNGDLDVGWVPDVVSRWTKVTKTFSDFSTAGLTNDIDIFTLPAKGVIHNVIVKPTVSFSGGTIASYDINVGIAGNFTKYAAAFDVFQATGNTVFGFNSLSNAENFGSTTSIRAQATATGDNLDQAAAGSVDIYIRYSVLA